MGEKQHGMQSPNQVPSRRQLYGQQCLQNATRVDAQQELLLIVECAKIQAQWCMHRPKTQDAATGVKLELAAK